MMLMDSSFYTGKVVDRYRAFKGERWSAGSHIYAYNLCKNRQILKFFSNKEGKGTMKRKRI